MEGSRLLKSSVFLKSPYISNFVIIDRFSNHKFYTYNIKDQLIEAILEKTGKRAL